MTPGAKLTDATPVPAEDALLSALLAEFGPRSVLSGDAIPVRNEKDWSTLAPVRPLAVVRPVTAEEVSATMRLCQRFGVPVVPQGGLTGLCGGALPVEGCVALSLERMTGIEEIDPAAATMTVRAGTPLEAVQKAADEAGFFMPLDLGARGSCAIGGNLSTNAGGNRVIRYGMARDMVLGLEVVLPDGQIWNGLRGLRKDNTGYDLKQLFIGAEGTLGIITAAVLKLYPAIRRRATAWAALADAESAVALLGTLRGYCGERLSGFELMSRQSLDFVLRHQPGSVDPFDTAYPWYLLVELSDPAAAAALDETLQVALGESVELGLLQDAVIASSQAQAAALWRLREGISEAQNHEGPSLKHDISVPISSIPAFIAGTGARLQEALPGVRIVCYGHVGDGNLHYNLSKPPGMEDAAFLAQAPQLTGQVFDATLALNGSISAEHGLGQAKRDAARHYKNPLEQALMRALKDTLDPKGLMNPGKVL